ncbi:uncharacterized protein LOC111597640 [Drosophila hydei]|uniref:Uncharacterized protein LOC111597640 n=1 Tax=Drosophila hydei TaxID=7224 RepID=A0A6J1LNA9_DROHY|nr:uncharacterized protein LOC111597640 [Drosophila hydei]
MRCHLCYLWLCSFVVANPGANVDRVSMDKLGFHNNYNAIVRDLIKNWESPIVYLRQLGYLPNDYEDTSKIKPNLDALMSRIEHDDQQNNLRTEDDKTKEQFCATNGGKTLQLKMKKKKKRKAVLQPKKSKRRERDATGTQKVNYPSVEHLLAMTQNAKPSVEAVPQVKQSLSQPKSVEEIHNSKLQLPSQLLQQRQQPAVQKPVADAKANDNLLQRLVKKIRTNADHKSLEVPQPNIVLKQSPIEAHNMLKLLNDSPDKSVSTFLGRKQFNGELSPTTIARLRRNLKSRLIRKLKHRNN